MTLSIWTKVSECYLFEIFDTYGDGMTAGTGGSYKGFLDGDLEFEGRDFGDYGEHIFCVDGSSPPNPPSEDDDDEATSFPTASCVDDPGFKFQNKNKKTCLKWVAKGNAKKVLNKCKKNWNQKKVYDWCPETCGKKAGIGSCDFLKKKKQ